MEKFNSGRKSKFYGIDSIWETNPIIAISRHYILPYGAVVGSIFAGAYVAYDNTKSITASTFGGLAGLVVGLLVKTEVIDRINGDYEEDPGII